MPPFRRRAGGFSARWLRPARHCPFAGQTAHAPCNMDYPLEPPMANPFAPPETPLAEYPETEAGWSTFSHSRRIALGANGLALAVLTITFAAVVYRSGMPGNPAVILAIGLYVLGCAGNCAILWRWRGAAIAALLACLINLGFLGFMAVQTWPVFSRYTALASSQYQYLATNLLLPIGVLTLPALSALVAHARGLLRLAQTRHAVRQALK